MLKKLFDMEIISKNGMSLDDINIANEIVDIIISEYPVSAAAAVIDTDSNITASSRNWESLSSDTHIREGIDEAITFFSDIHSISSANRKCFCTNKRILTCHPLSSFTDGQQLLFIVRDRENVKKITDVYHDIFEDFEEGYFELNLKGHLVYCNKKMSEITGYSRDEIYGISYRTYTTQSTSENLFAVFNEIYRTGKPSKISNFEFIRKDGARGFFEISSGLLMDEVGNPVGFRGICRDASERIKSENEKRLLADQLQQAQRFEAVATLAGGVAHDFNNLLMSIQGYLSLLQMTADPDSKNYTYLKKIEEHVEKGASLTRQMLGVSFSESGFSAPCCTDMNDLMKKIASDFLKNRQNINLSLLADSAPCFAMCDTAQMENVFSNILDNSVQAMENGGTITISTENVFCDEKFVGAFSNTRPGRYVLVSVTDNGSGMDEKTQRRIFNPFFTTRDTGRSSGIGLTSAFGIIKNHAGFITINSQLGVGTTVFVYLPAFENN